MDTSVISKETKKNKQPRTEPEEEINGVFEETKKPLAAADRPAKSSEVF